MLALYAAALLLASDPAGGFPHPHFQPPKGPLTVDMSTAKPLPERAAPAQSLRFDQLDDVRVDGPIEVPERRLGAAGSTLPPEWTQVGDGVVPTPMAQGFEVEPPEFGAFEDIPGNKYPRKHTLYLNFVGANLTPASNDISAEDISALAGSAPYPPFSQGETTAVAVAQAVSNDLAPYGVRVVYLDRPDPMVPYTMEMMGGDWTDTSLDSPAGGVAPTADCEALNQRHVVFTFNAAGAARLANTASQEAGHAWGLDHTLNCGSVMSYCGGGDQSFSTNCDTLCEEQCQGAGTIGCGYQHEVFCGEGSEAQNEQAELLFLFGDDTPDLEPPTIIIDSPENGAQFAPGANVDFRAVLDDDFGGVGWRNIVVKDGETFVDAVDYAKENLDKDGRIAINLTNLELGHYEITVRAEDHADQVSEVTVEFDVVEDPMETGSADSSTGGDEDPSGESSGGVGEAGTDGSEDTADSGSGDDDDDGGGEGGDTDGDSAGADGSDGGGCSVGGSQRGPSLLLLSLFGLGALRRRRA